MIGEDSETASVATVDAIATSVVDAQACQVANAISRNVDNQRGCQIAAAGHGGVLLQLALDRLQFDASAFLLSEIVGENAARCAPSLAVAKLLNNHLATVCDDV